MGYHGQLIKQSRITVRGRQSIDSKPLQGIPKHTEWCPNRADTDQMVPKNPRVGIIAYSPGYKAICHAPPNTLSLTQVPSSRLQAGQATNQE
jgi:hypothetical protein